MNQYCRYCINANVVSENQFYCQADNRVYDISKSKRLNRCKAFDFCENDLWRCDELGNFSTYHPRGTMKRGGGKVMQYSLFSDHFQNGGN